jgi:hypothetical protein
MKRNLIGTLSLVVLSLVLNATGHAQVVAKADVPFAFTVAQKTLPSGRYIVRTDGQGVITIQSYETGASVISLARKELPRNTSPKLIFHRVDNQYFLSQVWGAEGTGGLTVRTSALEKELQMSSAAPKTVGQIVIALN